MSNRYSKLSSLTENLYCEGSPVIITAGALLKDEQTGKILAQLKFKSIDARPIGAVMVNIIPGDLLGNPLGEAVQHQYLDLNVTRDSSFGDREPIVMPDATTRTVRVAVCVVIFLNKEVWKASPTAPWEPFERPRSIYAAFEDKELSKQYLLKFGDKAEYLYYAQKDLWSCVCGAINRQNEEACHQCGRPRALLAEGVDMEALRMACEARLEKEARIAEIKQAEMEARVAAQRAQKEAQNKKRIKIFKRVALIGIPIVIIGGVSWHMIGEYRQNLNDYASAEQMMQEENYEAAVRQYKSLGDFKDSASKLEEAEKSLDAQQTQEKEEAYQKAVSLFDDGHSHDAYFAFEDLGDYKDSETKKEEAFLQNQLDTFADNLPYFWDNKDAYELVANDQIASVITGTWIMPSRYSMSYLTMTFNADGSGSEVFDSDEPGADTNWEVAWIVNDNGFQYGYAFDGTPPSFEDYGPAELRKMADGVYLYFDDENEKLTDLFIAADSPWADRLKAAFDVYGEE